MNETKNFDWHLSNGFTFLAIELKMNGQDIILSKLCKANQLINLFYTHKTTEVNGFF